MTSSAAPGPQPTPEDQGIPDHADDDSTAFTEADRPRFRDSPPALPADQPQAVDEYGVTAAEQRQGEPLDARLDREEPDVAQEYGTLERTGGSAEEAAMHERSEQELASDERPEQS